MSKTPWTRLWLDYRKVNSKGNEVFAESVVINGFDSTPIIKNALQELYTGVREMISVETSIKEDGDEAVLCIVKDSALSAELPGTYRMKETNGKLVLSAGEETSVLYGVLHILRMLATEQSLQGVDMTQIPSQPLRMYNHWDNMDGSIERGYSGRSFSTKIMNLPPAKEPETMQDFWQALVSTALLSTM